MTQLINTLLSSFSASHFQKAKLNSSVIVPKRYSKKKIISRQYTIPSLSLEIYTGSFMTYLNYSKLVADSHILITYF